MTLSSVAACINQKYINTLSGNVYYDNEENVIRNLRCKDFI